MTHIVLSGKHSAEKTAMIRRLLNAAARPVYGFVTQKLPPAPDGFHPVYLHPAAQTSRAYRTENLVGICNRREQCVHPEVFDTLGVSLIEQAKPDGILVMNELGFMEANAAAFCQTVLAALDGEIPILAAIKERSDIAFLQQIRAHPNVLLCSLNDDEEALFARLRPIVQNYE